MSKKDKNPASKNLNLVEGNREINHDQKPACIDKLVLITKKFVYFVSILIKICDLVNFIISNF